MSSPIVSTAQLRFFYRDWPRRTDLRGGLVAAMMTLVTAVSYAVAAGAPLGPAMSAAAVLSGLIGATVGGLIAALASPVPGLVFSPRASVSVVIASALTTLGPDISGPAVLVWLSACLLLAAVLQGGFAMLKLGALIRLIPHSVTAGFTIGIAAEMALSQWPHVVGGNRTQGLEWVAPLMVGGATMAGIGWARWRGWAGWALTLGVLVGVAVNASLVAIVPDLEIPHLRSIDLAASPLVSLPKLLNALVSGTGLVHLPNLFGFAFVVAFVNSIETLTSTMVLEDLARHRFDANRALMAGALGSIVAVCAGGLPVAGSSATSVVHVRAGGDSRNASLVAACATGLLALLVGNALSSVPLAVVAGLMLTVAVSLMREPLQALTDQRQRRTGSRAAAGPLSGDMAVAALVCALMLTTGIVTAVISGVMAAAALIARQMRHTLVRRQYDANHPDAATHFETAIEPGLGQRIQIIEVAQPMFFATAEAVVEVLERLRHSTRFAILDLTHVGAVDATAHRVLARCGTALRQRNRNLLLVPSVRMPAFDSVGLIDPGCTLFESVGEALRFAARRCADEQRAKPTSMIDIPIPFPYPEPSPTSWSRRLQLMAFPLRDVRLPPSGVPEIHTPIDPRAVELAGRQLAVYIGPVARLLARRAAPRSPDLSALYRTLAQELHSLTEREAFLRQQPLGPLPPPERALDQPVPRIAVTAPSPPGVSLEATVLEQATHELTPYLGPIAKLLVKRAQAKALDREHLYHLLARQLSTVSDRDAFLSAAGIDPPSGEIA